MLEEGESRAVEHLLIPTLTTNSTSLYEASTPRGMRPDTQKVPAVSGRRRILSLLGLVPFATLYQRAVGYAVARATGGQPPRMLWAGGGQRGRRLRAVFL